MRHEARSFIGLAAAAVILLAAAVFTGAQTNVVPSRITRAIDPSHLTILRGNTNPLAQARFDRGAAPASLPMQRMLLVLKRSAQQEDVLDTLLEQQQNAASPNYHRWLTPQQFGQEFGPSDQDIQTITSWLQSEGFQIDQVSNGRTVIEFSGTAGEVQSAFHTTIHQYLVNGQNHWANSSDPQIPTALTPVVAGIDTLSNFPRHPYHELFGELSRNRQTGRIEPAQPLFTLGGPCGVLPNCYGVGPYDFAAIYNVLPLWNTSPTAIDGTGVTIAIVGESDINVQDVRDFRNYFGLPANDPIVTVVGPDPGTVPGDETESDLDVEWSGVVAKGATIDFVTSESTEASLGVDLSAEYIVDNNVAPILSESYGICELFLGSAGNQFYNQLWQQAAAQGITVLVATGDSGSAVCDRNAGTQGAAQYGLSVSGISSTPYNIAVGGTDFNDLTNATTYWGTNSPPPGQPTLPATVSAKSYIPETTWNDSCTNAVFGNLLGFSTNPETNCNNSQLQSFVVAVGASGGKSNCTGGDGQNPSSCTQGYPKPSWQTTLTPHDSARDVPDVSLYAAVGSPSGSAYLLCEADRIPAGYTSCNASDPSTRFLGVGGTSASTPAFAGIMALVNQATGTRQGNANYDLYALAAKSGARCNSSNGAGNNCVFYDTTNGTIEMPCAKGSPNCTVSNSNDLVGILSGYNTTSGYDLATGLGSVNATNLVNAWKSFTLNLEGSSTTLTLTPPQGDSLTNLTHGQPVTFSTSVTAVAPATGTPTGTVALIANTGSNGQEGVQSVTLDGSGNGSGTTNSLPGGTYTVEAQYPGDGTFGSSTSSGTSVTVKPEPSKVTLAYELFDPTTGTITNPNATTAVFGTPSLLRVNVTSAAGDACANNAAGDSGCPTGSVTLTDNDNSLDGGSFPLNPQGYAEDQLIDLTGGTHTIGASYGGDSSYSSPTPNPTTQTLTITPASTTTTFDLSGTATAGSPAPINVFITASNIYSSIGPTGSITVYSGTTPLGSVPVSGSVGTTTHSVNYFTYISSITLPHGQDSVTVQYSGDASYQSSVSTAQQIDVLYATTTTVTSSNSSVPHGTPVTFTAQVGTNATSGPSLTGSVQFFENGNAIGSSVTLSNGQAQITTSSLPAGYDTISATYSGDTNYQPSTGYLFGNEDVTLIGTTTTITTSNPNIQQGTSVTLTASIAPDQSGGPALTGTVQFEYAYTTVGSDNPIGSPVTVSNGQAQLTTSSLPGNTHVVYASYTGDGNYAGSIGSTAEVVTSPPGFTVTANPSTIVIGAPGQSNSTTLTFTSQGGLSGSATLSASSCTGLPAESACSFSPATINLPANEIAVTTLDITTTAPSAIFPGARGRWNTGGWNGLNQEAGIALAIFLLLAFGIVLGFQGRQRRWGTVFALVALVFVFVNAGCGGGGGNGGSTGTSNPGTPVGSQNVTVSVTINSVTQTVPITVNVQ